MLIAIVLFVAGAWIVWRYTAPVEVHLAADVTDLPFEVETIPPVVVARPGEVIPVVYRIRNADILPLAAFGEVLIEPGTSTDQIEIFLTQCGGLNTFQNGFPEDYEVLFRVQPAGLFGSSQLTLWHVFTRATPAGATQSEGE
jgi:hypothetical protein